MAEVALDEVSKRFGDVVAVDRITLAADDADLLVLLGPSGCGKSTVLRMIAGLEHPTGGTISIGGHIVNDVEPKQRDVAMVFQSYALYPHKTVRQNIAFPLRARKVPKDEQATQVQQAAALLGLDELLDRRPGQFSGGQRQRVALARAIVRRPAAFLMDEPLSNLDAKMRTQTRADLVELHQQLATTFVYVTHDQVEAMTMGTRVAVLDAGRIQQVGRPQEVYDRPANVFVARFIGSPPMSTLDGVIHEAGGQRAVRVSEGELPVPAAGAEGLVPGRTVVVGLRPEHLRLAGAGLAAKVRVVESLGHERHVVCAVAGGGTVTIRMSADQQAPADGEAVRVAPVAPDRVHLFDVETGERIGG